MTIKNVPITVGFAVITVSQLAMGSYIVSLTAERGGEAKVMHRKSHFTHHTYHFFYNYARIAQELLPIPLDAFRVCFHVGHGHVEVGSTAISLFYGAQKLL